MVRATPRFIHEHTRYEFLHEENADFRGIHTLDIATPSLPVGEPNSIIKTSASKEHITAASLNFHARIILECQSWKVPRSKEMQPQNAQVMPKHQHVSTCNRFLMAISLLLTDCCQTQQSLGFYKYSCLSVSARFQII